MKFSRNIRKKERSCSTVDDNFEDRLLPPNDPSEIEFQSLKVLRMSFALMYHLFYFRRKLSLQK